MRKAIRFVLSFGKEQRLEVLFSLPARLEDGSGSAYDEESLAIIKLNNTTVLYLKEVTKFLALVCILREESFERKGVYFYFLQLLVLALSGKSSYVNV